MAAGLVAQSASGDGVTRLTNAIISDRASVHEKVGVVGVASGFA